MRNTKVKNQLKINQLIKYFNVVIVLFLVSACYINSEAQEKDSKEKLRVLFIGNSLTYVNNLPEIVAKMAKSAKQKKPDFKMAAYPDFSLEDHWGKGDAHKLLAEQKWDYVVMQQGPSAGQEGRQVLIDYSKKFAEEIARAGAKPAFYMVWPSADRIKDLTGVGASYSAAAKEVSGLFLPAGMAWLEAWKRDPKIELYSSDGFHPNGAGSYLAALVIYQRLYGQSPIGLPHTFILQSGEVIDISKKQAEILQQAAVEANKNFAF